jgi:site-specific recombinase XerD
LLKIPIFAYIFTRQVATLLTTFVATFWNIMAVKLIKTSHPNIKIDKNSGTYYISQQINSVPVRKSLRTKKFSDAKNLYRKIMNDENSFKKTKKSNLYELLDEYKRYVREDLLLSEKKTIPMLYSRLEKLRKYFSDVAISQIQESDYLDYRRNLIESGLSKVTINNELREHRAFFNWCTKFPDKKQPFLLENPLLDIKYFSVDKRTLKSIDDEIILNFLAKCKDRDRSIYLICKLIYSIGLRISEVLRLSFNDFDRETNLLRIKGKTRVRYLEINEAAISVLNECKEMPESFYFKREYAKYGHQIDNSENLFFPQEREDSLQKRIRLQREKLGRSDNKITFHALRHSFATRLLERGVAIGVISEILGHTSVQTTMIYLNVQDERKAEGLRTVNINV